MKIIRAFNSHSKTIAKLNIFVQQIHRQAQPNIFKPYNENEEIISYFERILSNQNNYIFLSYLSDIPVGYLWAKIQQIHETPLTFSNRRIHIHHVSVDEKHRRKGVGASLLDEVKKLSKDLDIRDISVDTWAFNNDANHFFRSQGFDVYNFRMWII